MADDEPRALDEEHADPARIAGVDLHDRHDHTIDVALEAHVVQPVDQPPGVPEGAARDDELPPVRPTRR